MFWLLGKFGQVLDRAKRGAQHPSWGSGQADSSANCKTLTCDPQSVLNGGCRPCSSKLAILASAPVITTLDNPLFIELRLASNTQAHTRHGIAPRPGDFRVAFFTICQARSPWQGTAGALNGIVYGGVNLILHCPVTTPTTCHAGLPIVPVQTLFYPFGSQLASKN